MIILTSIVKVLVPYAYAIRPSIVQQIQALCSSISQLDQLADVPINLFRNAISYSMAQVGSRG